MNGVLTIHTSDICSGCPKKNEWGSDYCLACFLEGKQTILKHVIDDEIIEFPTNSMVIKGEYFTQETQ